MSGSYATPAFQTPNASAYKGMVEIKGGTGRRIEFYDFLFGASGTPSDDTITYSIIRTTGTAGAGASVTSEALDPADVASTTTNLEDLTTEATTAGIELFELPVNVRASYRWVAAPKGEIIVAATANLGCAFRSKSPGFILQTDCTVHHKE
jgi:hypothetical protein